MLPLTSNCSVALLLHGPGTTDDPALADRCCAPEGEEEVEMEEEMEEEEVEEEEEEEG